MDSNDTEGLVRRAQSGDEQATAELFMRHRERLRGMVRLRLDRRLQGRVDPSDVLQDAYVDVAKRIEDYDPDGGTSFYLWLRYLTSQTLMQIHRTHLGTKMRDARQEVSLYRGALPQASSDSLAVQLLGNFTSPSAATIRAEMQLKLQEGLNMMEPLDREVLALRHFEELSNNEVARILGLKKAAASNRYVRALKRLKETLGDVAEFRESGGGVSAPRWHEGTNPPSPGTRKR